MKMMKVKKAKFRTVSLFVPLNFHTLKLFISEED